MARERGMKEPVTPVSSHLASLCNCMINFMQSRDNTYLLA